LAIGASFGGFESLAIPVTPAQYRTATGWDHEGTCIRLHIGLEDTDDLVRDLEKAFDRFTTVAAAAV
jgi:cystathionine beta-lyase